MAKFADLTEAQRERLEMLAEEASEVIKCCTKILRHGYESWNPDKKSDGTNKQQLSKELLDMFTVSERMMFEKDIYQIDFFHSGQVWTKKMKYTHHQPKFLDPMKKK